MKKQIQSLLLAALFCGIAIPSWGQASTEGKEFWVALTLSAAPSSGVPTPFIAVSTKKPTTIKITNPNDPSWAGITRSAGANSWEVFEGEIPLAKWYPTSANKIDNIKPQAGQIHDFGLKVETDEDVSVFAALWMENSFDAANILPVHVLQYEYYTQDYPPYIKPSDGDALSMFTILAAENGTRVTITPSSETQDGHAANVSYNVSLNAGQTYYVISKTLQSLSGTHVISNDKKIAIFQGDVFTQIPGGKSARDCLYEQAMPIDYWGTKFVVTRSKEKDANRVRVTASNDGTILYIKGQKVATIQAGQTWEFEMYKTQPTQQNLVHVADGAFTEDALYMEASCPVAVYSYDVSNAYKADPTEMDGSRGDPSMVWIVPLEQRINDITFGVCGTNNTDKHYIDIVCQTAATADTKITPAPAENIKWDPVPGDDTWSYARVHLSTVKRSGNGNRVFRLENPQGCIAHVYGNGDDESYAYSVGSSAVKMGVNVDGYQFVDGFVAGTKFCLGHEFTFDANIGSNEVKRVDWDFGDGTLVPNGPSSTTHEYTTPGWYDVKAYLYGVPPCSYLAELPLGEVNFSFQVVEPEYKITKFEDVCLPVGTATVPPMKLDTFDTDDCWIKEVHIMHYGKKTQKDSTMTVKDSHYEPLTGLTYPLDPANPADYHVDTTINLGPVNQYGCDSLLKLHIDIITCLSVKIINNPESQSACEGEALYIPFDYEKGDIGKTIANINDKTVVLDPKPSDEFIALPTENLMPGKYKATISIEDTVCDTTYVYPIDYTVKYSNKIIAYKYNNVLAVYNKEFNGGYEFTAYKWYKDDDPNPVGTGPVYHTDGQMPPGSYYVVLTDKNGVTLPSCPKEVVERPFPRETTPTEAAAQKFFRDQRIFIQVGDATFNIFGQKVK